MLAMIRLQIALLLISAACLIWGCEGKQASLSGTVTLDGEKLKQGYISIIPADSMGEGPTAGAIISNGKYQISGLSPGKKILHIQVANPPSSATDRSLAQKSKEERIQAMRDQARRGSGKRTLPAPDFTGNDESIDIQLGSQVKDLTLEHSKK